MGDERTSLAVKPWPPAPIKRAADVRVLVPPIKGRRRTFTVRLPFTIGTDGTTARITGRASQGLINFVQATQKNGRLKATLVVERV